jgi:hypothetical protein
LLQRDQAEIERSAAEASKILVKPNPQAEIKRYLNPEANTPFAGEYAFHLRGRAR